MSYVQQEQIHRREEIFLKGVCRICVILSVVFAALCYATGKGRSGPSLDKNDFTDIVEKVFVDPGSQPGRSFAEYASRFEGRDIFQSQLERKKAKEQKQPVHITELTKNLKLVGVVLDKDPQAIIKDLQTNQNIFVHRLDEINGMVVEDIGEGRVILNINNQRMELAQ